MTIDDRRKNEKQCRVERETKHNSQLENIFNVEQEIEDLDRKKWRKKLFKKKHNFCMLTFLFHKHRW